MKKSTIFPVFDVLVDSNFEKIRSWSEVKSESNISFFILQPPRQWKMVKQFVREAKNSPCCTSYHDFEAFLRHLAFLTIINNFTFSEEISSPENISKKSKTSIYGPVLESEQKNSILIFQADFIFFSIVLLEIDYFLYFFYQVLRFYEWKKFKKKYSCLGSERKASKSAINFCFARNNFFSRFETRYVNG